MPVDSRTGLVLLMAAALAVLGIRLFWRPFGWLVRLTLQVAAGGLVLYAWDLVTAWPRLAIAVNVATSAVVGILGPPGFLLLLAMRVVG